MPKDVDDIIKSEIVRRHLNLEDREMRKSFESDNFLRFIKESMSR